MSKTETFSEKLKRDFGEYGDIELVNFLKEKNCAFVNFFFFFFFFFFKEFIFRLQLIEKRRSCRINGHS